jgi:hypothetical protein
MGLAVTANFTINGTLIATVRSPHRTPPLPTHALHPYDGLTVTANSPLMGSLSPRCDPPTGHPGRVGHAHNTHKTHAYEVLGVPPTSPSTARWFPRCHHPPGTLPHTHPRNKHTRTGAASLPHTASHAPPTAHSPSTGHSELRCTIPYPSSIGV